MQRIALKRKKLVNDFKCCLVGSVKLLTKLIRIDQCLETNEEGIIWIIVQLNSKNISCLMI